MTKVLLLGLGRRGVNHLRNLNSLPIELYVAEVGTKQLEPAQKLGLPDFRLTTNYKDFASKVDCVVVVTPAQTHFPLCKEFLEASKDGRVMLKHLDAFNDRRREIAARYNERLKSIVKTPPERPWAKAVYHMFVIRAERRDDLQKFLKERNIETGIHYPVPNHQQPAITNKFKNIPRLPKTEQAVKEILSLPIHGEMSLDAANKVCDAIGEFYGKK